MNLSFFIPPILSFTASIALATPAGMTLQGRLVKDEIAVSGPVTLTVSIMTPNSDLCYLFQETHSFTLAATDAGIFSVRIGGGTRASQDKGFSLVNVFSNTGNEISGLTCTGNGGVESKYTSQAGDSRYVYLHFNTSVGAVAFNQPYVIQSVPYAMEAEKLAGKSASEFLQTSTDTTQSKLNDLMIPANYAELLDLLNGSSAKYMTSSNSSPAKLPVLSAPPSAPTAGQIWYEGGVLKYFDGTSSQVKSIGSYTGASAPSTTDGYGITNAVIKGGQAGALVIGSTDSNLMLNADNTTKMTILGNGNVGIGTTSPIAKLEIVQSLTNTSKHALRLIQDSTTTTNATLYQRNFSFEGAKKVNPGATDNGYLWGSWTQSFRNLSSTGDNGTLATLGGANIIYGHYNSDSAASPKTTTAYGIQVVPYFNTGTITNAYDLYLHGGMGGGTITNRYGVYQASVNARNYFAGNVGIGVSTPTYGLDLLSTNINTARFKSSESSSASIVRVHNSLNTGLEFTSYGPSYSAGSFLNIGPNGATISTSASGPLGITTHGAQPLILGTTNSERMRITNSGNIGIGTTSPQATLDVNGDIRLKVNSSAPLACTATINGRIALTSQYTMCVCKGSSSAWVLTSDGTTACLW